MVRKVNTNDCRSIVSNIQAGEAKEAQQIIAYNPDKQIYKLDDRLYFKIKFKHDITPEITSYFTNKLSANFKSTITDKVIILTSNNLYFSVNWKYTGTDSFDYNSPIGRENLISEFQIWLRSTYQGLKKLTIDEYLFD